MIPVWPSALPARVLRDGFGLQPQSPNRRTEMDDGAVAVTRRYARIRTVLSVRWEMSARQFEVFKDFWRKDLNGGAAWFDAPVFLGYVTVTRRVRFASDPPWQVTSPAAGIYFVNAELELADLPALTDSERTGFETDLVLFGGAEAVAIALADANARLGQINRIP